jgi:hypothetical protein
VTTPYTEPWENKTRALTADASHQPTPTPPLVRNPVDRELNAMRTVDTILSRLDNATCARVLSWVHSRVMVMGQVPASATRIGGDFPWPTHTVNDLPPLTRGKTEDVAADYEWPMVSVYLKEPKPILGDLGDHGDHFTVREARQYATELLSAVHRVDTHTETT